MKKTPTLIVLLLTLYSLSSWAQINYTANERVRPYTEDFGYGANMGYYTPWKDEQLAEIAMGLPDKGFFGAGVNTLRPALFAHFLEYYGYDIRVPTFQYYQDLGYRNNVVFIGYPDEAHRETKEHCPGYRSEMFANMYTDIWDDGANGTPVNDENYYALYLYKMVTRYKDFVKVWEIWNEPDFDYSGKAWKPKTIPDNWWEANPDPCDYAIRAPVFDYIRMLRISWEVIKTLSPESYVAVGGLGFPSFMDAVLRNTDNPDDGKTSPKFPLRGGAYFDLMSFHSYPHIDGSLREWSDETGGFVYQRHSDAAVAGMLDRKNQFKEVLHRYGYDGSTYPEKIYIITECNLPRKAFSDFIGSEEAQYNFIIKALVASQKNAIEQFHIYHMGELNHYDKAKNEYDLMGLFQKLENTPPYQQVINKVGIAYKTTSDLLYTYAYDSIKTKQLNLPPTTDGAAFSNKEGTTRYVLWAKTTDDQSENASASYEFPKGIATKKLRIHAWDYSTTQASTSLSGRAIPLTGTPIILAEEKQQEVTVQTSFKCTPSTFTDSFKVLVNLSQKSKVNLSLWNYAGQKIHSFAENEQWNAGSKEFVFDQPLKNGLYICRLETENKTLIQRMVKVAKP